MMHPRFKKLEEVWRGFLTPTMWEAIVKLNSISPFNGHEKDSNLIDHMIKNHEEWLTFLNEANEETNRSLPGGFSKFLTGEEKEH